MLSLCPCVPVCPGKGVCEAGCAPWPSTVGVGGEPPGEGQSWAWECGKKGCVGTRCSHPRIWSCSSEVNTHTASDGHRCPLQQLLGELSPGCTHGQKGRDLAEVRGDPASRPCTLNLPISCAPAHVLHSLTCNSIAAAAKGETSAMSTSQLKTSQLWLWCVPGAYSTLTLPILLFLQMPL